MTGPVLEIPENISVKCPIFCTTHVPFSAIGEHITPTTLLVVNAFTTNTPWTQAVRFESLMLVFCMETVNCLLIAALLDRC